MSAFYCRTFKSTGKIWLYKLLSTGCEQKMSHILGNWDPFKNITPPLFFFVTTIVASVGNSIVVIAKVTNSRSRTTLHTAGAREIWIDQSGLSRWEKIYCPHINVSWQERHWNQATFLIGDCIKYSLKGIYNSKNHFTVQKVKNMKHLVSPSF